MLFYFFNSREGVWKYFVEKCSENLHVALSMSPSGDLLRNRCRSFPGLVGNTTIDWIFTWPKQALVSVAKGYISENRKIPDVQKDSIISHVVYVHKSLDHYSEEFFNKIGRKNYVTPKHFIDFVATYVSFIEDKYSSITKQIERYRDGIKKINDASAQIEILKVSVEVTKKDSLKATEECNNVLGDIESATENVIEKKRKAIEKSSEVDNHRKQIAIEQVEAESSLREAIPDLERARAALDTLQKKDITEIRAFANPPDAVQIICECVAILKGYRDISWKTAKGMLSEMNFLKSLQEINCDLISTKQTTSCRAHMKVNLLNHVR